MSSRNVNVVVFLAAFGLGVFVGWFAKGDGQHEQVELLRTNVGLSTSSDTALSAQTAAAEVTTNAPDLLQEGAQARAQEAMDEMRLLDDRIRKSPLNPELLEELGKLIERYLNLNPAQETIGEIPAFVYLSSKHPLLL